MLGAIKFPLIQLHLGSQAVLFLNANSESHEQLFEDVQELLMHVDSHVGWQLKFSSTE